ncbi:MAG: TonB-dependent receptor [Micrococcales bacterium]|nr:TonB-dependent receptor [Micrococcales bacterium]
MTPAVVVVPSAPMLLPRYTGRIDAAAPLRERAVAAVRAAAAGGPGAEVVLVVATDRTPGSVYEGNRLARRPKHLANAELGWTPGGAFAGADLSVAARYAGKSFDDRANNVTLDDYWLVDLRASYPLVTGIDVYGRIENLFDTDYQTVAGYGTAGRSAYVGVRWAF